MSVIDIEIPNQPSTAPDDAPSAASPLLWDELFHACALEAYITVAADTNCVPPDREKTRLIAYRLFEERLPNSKPSSETTKHAKEPSQVLASADLNA